MIEFIIVDALRQYLARLKIINLQPPDSPLLDEYSPAAPTPPPLPARGRRYTIFEKSETEAEEQGSSSNTVPNIDDHNLRRRSSIKLAVADFNRNSDQKRLSGSSMILEGPKLANHWAPQFGRPSGRPSISLPGFTSRRESVQSVEIKGPKLADHWM